MHILILSRKFEIYSTRRLVEEIQASGHIPFRWDPAWPISKYAASLNVLLPRIGNFRFQEATTSLENLSFSFPGSLVINNHEVYKKARNKWTSYIAFLENQISTPYSEFSSAGKFPCWSKHFPCIIKKLESSKGEGVFLARTAEEFTQITNKITEDYLIQEAFPECFGEDIRAFIVGGKIVACMKRKSSQDFRSNLALGGVGEVCTLTPAEEELVLRSAEALNLQIAGVDLLRTHRGSLILEANPCPGLEGIEKYTQVNVAHEIIQYLEELHDMGMN